MSRINEPETTGQGQQGAGGAISQAAGQVGENLRDLGNQVRDVAGKQYEQLRDTAQDYYRQGRERATEWEQNLEEYVREKPVQSLLIAAGVGVVLGLLWKRS